MMLTMDPKSSEKAVMARREIITRRVHIHNYYVGVRFDYWYRDEKEASSSTMARNENSAILSVGVRQPAQKIGGLTMTNRERQEINETARGCNVVSALSHVLRVSRMFKAFASAKITRSKFASLRDFSVDCHRA